MDPHHREEIEQSVRDVHSGVKSIEYNHHQSMLPHSMAVTIHIVTLEDKRIVVEHSMDQGFSIIQATKTTRDDDSATGGDERQEDHDQQQQEEVQQQQQQFDTLHNLLMKTQPAAHGIQLLRELQLDRSVPKYNTDALSKIEKEMRDLENGLKRTIMYQQREQEEEEAREQRRAANSDDSDNENDNENENEQQEQEQDEQETEAQREERALGIGSSIVFQHQSLLRNRRCVLAYHFERMKRLRKLRWGAGAVQNIPNFVQRNMSDSEKTYLDAYDELLREYTDSVGLDLFSDVTPPKDVFVEVKVIKVDEGAVEGLVTMESGVVKLQMNQRLFLRRIDAEMLMQKGLVEHVTK